MSTWAVQHTPSSATKATISKAAVAGIRHVCESITVSIAAGATAQTPVGVVLRDGATGAGTILWSAKLAAPVDGCAVIALSGLNIMGSVDTAMTLEFAAAGVTASEEAVSMAGHEFKVFTPVVS